MTASRARFAYCLAVALLAGRLGDAAAGDLVGDAGRGAEIYERCGACHSLTRNRTGPKHCGVVGRPAASVAGFAYSDAMARSGLVWTAQALDAFLTAPLTFVPGTTMGYAGIADVEERADLIAFLAEAQAGSGLCQ